MKNRIVRLLECRGAAHRLLALWSAVVFLPGVAAAQPAQRQTLYGHIPPVVSQLEVVSRLPESQRLKLAIGLPLRSREALTNLLGQFYDPASPRYHQYLTPEQFTADFGPTEADYQAVLDFARAHHLAVIGTHPNRTLVNVEATVEDIEKTFNVRMHNYQHPWENRQFYAPDAEPSVDLATPLLAINGLNNYRLPRPLIRHSLGPQSSPGQSFSGSGPGGTYMGSDFRAAYVPGSFLTGVGEVVALFECADYFPSDIATYEILAGLPSVPLQKVRVDGGAPPPFPFDGGNGEVALDIEMAVSMAPGLSEILVYEGPDDTPTIDLDILNRIASDNLARQISSSWLIGDDAQYAQIYQQFAAQGQSFFQASGDSGGYYPGIFQFEDSPLVTLVGGTTLTTSGPGGAWVSETVWNNGYDPTAGHEWAGGGGISQNYSIPVWQQGIDMTASQGSTTMRNVPDVALTADNIFVLADDGVEEPSGGTSAAAPLWAAFAALVNQQAAVGGQPPLGFPNPALYAIGKGASYTAAFHDITTGNNTNLISTNLFYAVPGYDLATGWGVPAGTSLINILAPPVPAAALIPTTNVISGGNGNGAIDPNECDSLSVTLLNIGSLTGTGIHAALASATPGVVIAQALSDYPNIPPGGGAQNLTPFKVSTSPTFVCGTPVVFSLTVKSDEGTTTNSFTIQTGIQSVTNRFDSNVAYPLSSTNLVGTSSPIVVSNISTFLNNVAVSLHVVHPYDAFLQLSLIAPDGTTCLLSANNGGFSPNYGSACSPDSARTTFDDSATTLIDNGFPPFAGSFKPDQPLAVFAGNAGTNVNGTWNLQVVDQAALGVGSIECWSLLLSTASCPDGGGTCPGVDLALGLSGSPNPVYIGGNLVYTITITNFGPSIAHGVTVSHLLPSGAVFVSAVASQGSAAFSSGTVTAGLGTMAIGATATVTVTVLPTAAGLIFSSATVTAIETELNPANNSATVSTVVKLPAADLAVGLAAAPNPALVGGVLTYSVSVTNLGPTAASGVTVTNFLPASVGYLSATPSQGIVTLLPGNVVVCSFGSLAVNAIANASIRVTPGVQGTISATATAGANQNDPFPANNTAVVSTTIGPAADVAVSIVGMPDPVVLSGRLTYKVTVANNGPSTATSVAVNGTLPNSVTVVSNFVSQGAISLAGATLTGNLGFLPSGAAATIFLYVTPNLAGTITATVTVTATEADPNPLNNTATSSTVVSRPFLAVTPAGASLLSESISPPNGAIDIGETVTVSLRLANTGNVPNTNLVATLLPGNGVTQIVQPTRTYGVLAPSGFPVAQPFTFTAAGTNGGSVVAALQIIDAGGYSNTVTFTFALPNLLTFANTNVILIPDPAAPNPPYPQQAGPAKPYPASLTVSGVTSAVSHVTATLSNLSHSFVQDVNVLLVGPSGAKTLLLSHAGFPSGVSSVNLTFDDSASSLLPASGSIASGSWQPSVHTPPAVPVFPTNALAGGYSTNLSIFNGISPNGAWSLYVYDDDQGDAGQIAGGWSLALYTIVPINQVADLALSGLASPTPVHVGENLTNSFTITNAGPATANAVAFTNLLPSSVTLVSASCSQGLCLTNAGSVIASLGNMNSGAVATVTVVLNPTVTGWLTNTATVSASQIDLSPGNETVSLAANVVSAYSDLGITQTALPNPAYVNGSNADYILTVTNGGPNTAANVVVTDSLPPGVGFVAVNSSLGVCTNVGRTVTCTNLSLSAGGVATIDITVAALSTGVGTNLASVTSASVIDTNTSNNSSSLLVTNLSPVVVAAAVLVAEGFYPPNGAVDSGETVTVSFSLANAGLSDIASLVATLQSSGGVSSLSGPQTYGLLQSGGPPVSRSFTFTAGTPVGGAFVASFALQNGTNNLGLVSFAFPVPVTTSFANPNAIIIPDFGPGSPYPATINVSGLTGLVSKVTATINGLSHSYASDVNVLLLDPAGASTLLMSHAGAGHVVSNANLTFDDAAALVLPPSAQLTSGTYKPTAYSPSVTFPGAFSTPYGATLATHAGASPNGSWNLFVLDDSAGDNGIITSGWTLNVTTFAPLNPVADLAVGLSSSPASLFPYAVITNIVSVTNLGPASATGVVLIESLPAGFTVLSNRTTQGANLFSGATLSNYLGTLSAGATVTVTLVASPSQSGNFISSASVAGNITDLNPANNAASAATLVKAVSQFSGFFSNGLFQVTISDQGGTVYAVAASTNLTSWTYISTNTVPHNGLLTIPDPNTPSFKRRFYRALRLSQ
jgi:uncharacterized repeat protein (TIGR01451 family)